MENLLLSIIVPVYNAQPFLENNLESLVQLNFKDHYEVILVNDGSSDNSGEICNQFQMKYYFFKVIHQQNTGVSGARNTGISHAKGDYLMFVDADDSITNNCIERNISVLRREAVDLLLWNKYDAVHNSQCFYPSWNKEKENYNLDLNKVYSLFLNLHCCEPWGKTFAREIIVKYDILFPTNINLGEDLIFNLNFLKKVSKSGYIPDAMYIYNTNLNGLSKQNKCLAALPNFNSMYQEMLNFIDDMKLGQDHKDEVCCSILQSVTNYCGKLYANGYRKKDIFSAIELYPWYQQVIDKKYFDMKSIVRKTLLKYKFYFLISKIFNR